MPMERVDFIRIVGMRWIEDPNNRFSSLDFRESLLTLIPKVEAAVLDTLLKQFQLQEGELQRTDVPVLPQRVVREAIVNAVMHRDYRVHSPTQVVRYSDRIEIYNAGYSLKPVEELGTGASELRNPILASILYDLSFAETKGSGIRTIRTLLREANLEEASFVSNVTGNSFRATYSLNQLMSKEDLLWLGQFKGYELNDNEARALLIAKNLGAVNNATLREDTNLDTLQASHVLQRLGKEYDLLVKHGAGTATTYTLNWTRLQAIGFKIETSHLGAETPHLEVKTESHIENAIAALGYRAKKEKVQKIIVQLCLLKPQTKDDLIVRLNKGEQLVQRYLKDLRTKGILEYFYPQIPNHPTQAYKVTEYGKKWLENSNE